jgi:shikimate kinase
MKVFLVGLPGSGKTSLGRMLAKALHVPFVDLDAEIERQDGRPVKGIFKEEGENRFREMEAAVLEKFCNAPTDFVMATGGGAPCYFNNMDAINRAGVSVFLDVPVRVIVERMMRSHLEDRPLLAAAGPDGLKEQIEFLRSHRLAYYQRASVTVAGDTITAEQVLKALPVRES